MAIGLDREQERQQLLAEVDGQHMAALWTLTQRLLTPEPVSKAIPWIWHWDDYWPLCQRAGELVPIERGGDRRVLAFINPGFTDRYATTHTLWAAVQYLLPGEIAPAHRHSPCAIRFIIEGSCAYTTVDGDKVSMSRGDLVLTPAWTLHDHGHEGTEPMIWMDGLDLPLVGDLEAIFFEAMEGAQQQQLGDNLSERRYRTGQLKPAGTTMAGGASPLLNYRWEQTYAALSALAEADADPYEGLAVEYINPHTGGPALPTMGCHAQMLRPGMRTRKRRHVASTVYHVFEGSGYSIIAGQRLDWKQGDFLCVPTWAWCEHGNESNQEAILFSITDKPVMEALGLYRQQGE